VTVVDGLRGRVAAGGARLGGRSLQPSAELIAQGRSHDIVAQVVAHRDARDRVRLIS
jgi:hypothetical protein